MSRFVLAPGATIRSLGNLVLQLAKLTYRPANQPFEINSVEDLEPLQVRDDTGFLPSFSAQIEGNPLFEVGDSNSPGGGEIQDGTIVVFHFDRTHVDENGNKLKVVNVVIPDLEGKFDPDGDPRPGNPDLDGAAEDSIGFVVYGHCSG